MGRVRGRKPYMHGDYRTMMKANTNLNAAQDGTFSHSDTRKPYRNDSYPEMEHIYPGRGGRPYDIPSRPPREICCQEGTCEDMCVECGVGCGDVVKCPCSCEGGFILGGVVEIRDELLIIVAMGKDPITLETDAPGELVIRDLLGYTDRTDIMVSACYAFNKGKTIAIDESCYGWSDQRWIYTPNYDEIMEFALANEPYATELSEEGRTQVEYSLSYNDSGGCSGSDRIIVDIQCDELSVDCAFPTLYPNDDVLVIRNNPDVNADTGGLFVRSSDAGDELRSLLYFDVSSFSGTPQTATLRLYLQSVITNDITIEIYQKDDYTWTEETATWNTESAYTGAASDSVALTTSDSAIWVEFDVLSLIDGTDLHVVLISDTENQAPSKRAQFHDKENASGNSPELVLT